MFCVIFSVNVLLSFDDILKYFININWNFEDYLFGRKNMIVGLDFSFSLVVWISYFIVIMFITIVNFKKKNIRNI